MAEVNIDELLAARVEAVGDNAVILGGYRYRLKPWLTFAAAAAWDAGDRPAFLREALADPADADRFMATPDLSWMHFNPILDALKAIPGESPAS